MSSSNQDPTKYFSSSAKQVLSHAKELANGKTIYPVHILLSIADIGGTVLQNIFTVKGVFDETKYQLFISNLTAYADSTVNTGEKISPKVQPVLIAGVQEGLNMGVQRCDSDHLLLGVLQRADDSVLSICRKFGVTYARVQALYLAEQNGDQGASARPKVETVNTATAPNPGMRRINPNSPLEKYGENFTTLARKGALDVVIGREDEINRIIHVLSRKSKNNPILVGEPGTGKSAIVEGLAQRIVSGDVPDSLLGKQIYSIDLGGMIAGTRFRGEFEERMKGVIDEATKRDDVILFFDEIHTIRGAGSGEGAVDASNMMKPHLARGTLKTIGATTMEEYRQYFEKDAALARRYQAVKVKEPSSEVAVEILTGLAPAYEKFHGVTILPEAVQAAVTMSTRYIKDRFLPDKAIDMLDEASAQVKLAETETVSDAVVEQVKTLEGHIKVLEAEIMDTNPVVDSLKIEALTGQKEKLEDKISNLYSNKIVTAETIATVVAKAIGVPVARVSTDETKRLLVMEREMAQRVVGQEQALKALARTVRRQRTGLKDPNRPMGSFVFAGPTGVGKTEIAKTLAEYLFNDEKALITVDMSEYSEEHSVSKLFGAAPGYVGFEQGGSLTERIYANPFSVVLFDEIEKAHPKVFDPLLQVLEEGRMTDGQGREINFQNTVIIMTTNMGAADIAKQSAGFATGAAEDEYRKLKEKVNRAIKETLRPEFINRIDEIIVFPHLSETQLREIVDKMITKVAKRLQDSGGHELVLTDEAKNLLAEKGYDKTMGARPLRRAIQEHIETPLSELLLFNPSEEPQQFVVDAVDGEFVYNGTARALLEDRMVSLEYV